MDDANSCLLLVDSDPHILSSLRRLFRRKRFQILLCQDTSKAFELLAQNDIGVIIADQHFSGGQEDNFFQQVSSLYPDSIRIALTGFTDIDFITNMVNTGAIYKLVTKPWDDNKLLEIVAEAFEYYYLRHQNSLLTSQLEETNKELKKANDKFEKQNALLTTEAFVRQSSLSFAQEMLYQLPTAVIGVDSNRMIAFVNHSAKQLIKHNAIQLGDNLEVLPPAIQDCMQSFLANGKNVYQIELASKSMKLKFIEIKSAAKAKGYILTMDEF